MKKIYLSLLSISFLVAMIIGFTYYQSLQPVSLSLRFKAVVGDKALDFNQLIYSNPGGIGTFKIRDFQFFISNIKLVDSDGNAYLDPESYYLARFDNMERVFSIIMDKIPNRNYNKIEFAIGVDKKANNSILLLGALDPNSRMAWSWEVGYKFVLFEGGLQAKNYLKPLVYHVGFDENYKVASYKLPKLNFRNNIISLNFEVDILKMFKGVETIDMNTLSSIKFDRSDASLFANNFAQMIALHNK